MRGIADAMIAVLYSLYNQEISPTLVKERYQHESYCLEIKGHSLEKILALDGAPGVSDFSLQQKLKASLSTYLVNFHDTAILLREIRCGVPPYSDAGQ